jgi:hypothetical protein
MESEIDTRPRVNGRMWSPGQSGNPLGRPIGARGRFSQQFIDDMRASWDRHGATVMDRVAVEYPDRYLGIAAHLIPKEIEATISAAVGGLDATDFAILRAIRDAIPAANQQQPGDVLRFVEEAVKAHASVPMIEANPTDKQSAGAG